LFARPWNYPSGYGNQLIHQSMLNYGLQSNVLQQVIANQALGYY
jgi:hypothetical protein